MTTLAALPFPFPFPTTSWSTGAYSIANAPPQNVLKESNRATLTAVAAFVRDTAAAPPPGDRIPAALIVTGPNIASQDLLFSQLGVESAGDEGRFVRLRAAEAPNLKAALRKIVRDVVTRAVAAVEEDGELDIGKDVSCVFFFPCWVLFCVLSCWRIVSAGFCACCWLSEFAVAMQLLCWWCLCRQTQ